MSIKVTVEMGDTLQRAERAAEEATRAVAAELFAAMQQSFTADVWNWPRDLPTRKLTGATVAEKLESYQNGDGITPPNPRNIIDEGNLRQSGAMNMTGQFEATFTWSANYAAAVHLGARIYPWGNRKARRVLLPARPWTSAVLGTVLVPGIEPFPFGERLRNVWLVKFRTGR